MLKLVCEHLDDPKDPYNLSLSCSTLKNAAEKQLFKMHQDYNTDEYHEGLIDFQVAISTPNMQYMLKDLGKNTIKIAIISSLGVLLTNLQDKYISTEHAKEIEKLSENHAKEMAKLLENFAKSNPN